jgi:DNA-directed RNA polymerase subunit F
MSKVMQDMELRILVRTIEINPQSADECKSLYEEEVLQYKDGYGEWRNVPRVREDD